MASTRGLPMLIATFALSLAAVVPFATTATAQNTPQVYGGQLRTQQERIEYRQRLRNAGAAEERARIRAEHHQKMRGRAKDLGVTLPKEPPAKGMGQGRGRGMGQGGGRGRSG